MSDGFEGSGQRTELTTTDRQELRATLKEDRPAHRQLQTVTNAENSRPKQSEVWVPDVIWEDDRGFSLVRYRVSPRGAPQWAIENWRDAIKICKRSGCSAASIRALVHQKVDDLHCIVEALNSASPQQRCAVEEAWKSFHRVWVDDQVRIVKHDKQPTERRDPHSLRSIKKALPRTEQRTWEVYRKLMLRTPRGTGQRNRQPSKEKLALTTWAQTQRRFETILRLLIIKREPARFVERQNNLAEGDAVRSIGPALVSLQIALDQAKGVPLALTVHAKCLKR